MLTKLMSCLLYTSDAADERSSVDLGGRRIIKKKKKKIFFLFFFFFQAEDGIRDAQESRGLGDVYKRQDCHLTVPWYLNVNEAHEEVEALGGIVRNKYGEAVELF